MSDDTFTAATVVLCFFLFLNTNEIISVPLKIFQWLPCTLYKTQIPHWGYKALQELGRYLSRCLAYHVPLAHQPPATLHSVPQAHHAHSPASEPLHLQSLSYKGLLPDCCIAVSSGLISKSPPHRGLAWPTWIKRPPPLGLDPTTPFYFLYYILTLVVETQYHLSLWSTLAPTGFSCLKNLVCFSLSSLPHMPYSLQLNLCINSNQQLSTNPLIRVIFIILVIN